MNYKSLDASKIVATVESLQQRVNERFPEFGIGKVCEQLLEIARLAKKRSEWVSRPILILRVGVVFLSLVIVGGVVMTLLALQLPVREFDLPQFIQVIEAGINDVIFMGIAIFFMTTLETRVKRSRALKAIHELRALAHIIDMHQLTKDSERVLPTGVRTASSPKLDMTPFMLNRYLDYCSEMVSVVGKIAALYVQKFDDGVVLDAVNEVETLTTGLARKIWQKIMILNARTASLPK